MPLDIVESIADLRGRVASKRRAGPIGLVPTMGALHQGHARLIAQARQDCPTVVVSLFVNPTQFDRPEDLKRYPRTLDADADLCRSLGVDLLFAPSVQTMYPTALECSVEVGRLADHLCGRYRPGHFKGVATVVLKLFQIVQPDTAYFGEKDAQQLAVVRRMVSDFNIPVTIVGIPTVREPDGLALSSRNTRLNASERQLAPALYKALRRVEEDTAGGVVDAGELKRRGAAQIPDDD